MFKYKGKKFIISTCKHKSKRFMGIKSIVDGVCIIVLSEKLTAKEKSRMFHKLLKCEKEMAIAVR